MILSHTPLKILVSDICTCLLWGGV
jgi:hypothetical protein